ncbi:extracellular solute-binding protein [candidate division KSB1 bacterium]
MIKKWIKVLFIFALIINTAGCGKLTERKLRVTTWESGESLKISNKIAAEFERLNPGLQVIIESIPSNYNEKIMMMIASGTPPDVFILDSNQLPAYINKDLLLDLSPYLEEAGYDTTLYYRNILSIAQRNDKLYALPNDFTTLVVYYNKDLFDDAGVEYPGPDWTWDDFLDKAKKLTRDTNNDGEPDVYGFVLMPSEYYLYHPWIWLNGGDILDPSGSFTTGYLNSPETEQAYQFLIDLDILHHVTPSSMVRETSFLSSMFTTRAIGMMVSGHWSLLNYKRLAKEGVKYNLGVAPLPKVPGKERVTVMYETGYCVPKNPKRLKESVKLAAFLGGEFSLKLRAESGVGISSMKKVAEEVSAGDDTGLEQVFIDVIPEARQPWGSVVEDFAVVEELSKDIFDIVMINKEDIHTVCTKVAAQIDKTLEKRRTMRYGGDSVSIKTILIILIFTGLLMIMIWIFRKRKDKKLLKSALTGYGFLLPSFVHIMVFFVGPVLFIFFLSFHQWNIILPKKPFIWLDNYVELVKDKNFLRSLFNTFYYALHVPVGMSISLVLAVLVNRKIRGINIIKTLFFLPSVSSFVAIAMVWQWIYNSRFGLLNYFITRLGFDSVKWLENPQTAMPALIIMSIWVGMGYQMVIFLAGLQGIPQHLYEVARIDGANPVQRFFRITLPLLKPTTFFILVTSLIGSFQVFTQVFVMTKGGPLRATDVAVYHIYKSAWVNMQMGYSSAMAVVLFAIIFLVTLVQFKYAGKEVNYT